MSETLFKKLSAPGAFAFIQRLFAWKQAREQLQFQATILHNVSESVIVTDLQGHIIYWNEGATSLFGYSAEEMLGNTPALLYPETQQQLFLPDIERILQGKDYYGAWKGRRKDGTVICIDVKTTVLRNTRGQAIGFIGSAKDITERKRAEEASLWLAAIVESCDDAIIGKTREGIIISWNRAAERMYGYSAAEAVGQPITLIFPPDRQDEFATIMERITQGERIDHFETSRVRKDGTVLLVSVTVSPIRESDGHIIGASAVARNITEQKRLETEVRQAKRQLEVIFHNIADGITVQDSSGTVIYVNDAGARLSGFASAQAMLAFDKETLRAHIVERMELKDEFGQPVSFADLPATKALQGQSYAETLINYRDRLTGRSFWSVVKASPIVDDAGQVQLVVNIFSDITVRMELEQRKDEFMSMASHELKTPITSLKGYTQLLKMRMEKQGGAESVAMLDRMDKQLTRLTQLIADFLDVSKIQAGQLDFAREPIDFDAFIHDIADTMQQISTTHTITIHGATQTRIIGDRDRLEQVFTNLLSNAVKYSPQATQVDISMTASQDTVTVSIRDYGIGIPKEHQPKIFERFYRVSGIHDKTFPGLGMGLYISAEIVKRHDGRLWVESAENEGTTFFISLPIA
jgi:PAS domain S-box-containing protein